jgi:hypothetical protein
MISACIAETGKGCEVNDGTADAFGRWYRLCIFIFFHLCSLGHGKGCVLMQ